MNKGTTNGALRIGFALLALVGCGGRAESQGSASVGGAPSVDVGSVAGSGTAAPTPGVGPIDTTGLPTQLPIDCPGMAAPPQLVLPCKVGAPLNGGPDGPGSYNALECYDVQGRAALGPFIPFGSLQTMLNQPVQFPFASLPAEPGTEGLQLTGTVVFSQVDPIGRAFVARLIGGTIPWTGANGEPITCTIPDTPFWAVKGDFI